MTELPPENVTKWEPAGKTSLKPEFSFQNIDLEVALNTLIYGCTITKVTKFGSLHLRRFFLDSKDGASLHWISPHKMKRTQIRFREIFSITIGKQSKKFTKNCPDSCITILYKGKKAIPTELNLVFDNQTKLTQFVVGLEYLILDVLRSFSMRNSDDKCLEENWKLMDPENTNKLTFDMLKGLLVKLKFGMYPKIFQYLLDNYDYDKDKMIDFTEFKEFQLQLTKMTKLNAIYERVIKKDHLVIMEGFWKFLKYEQRNEKSYTQVWNLIVNYSDYSFTHLEDMFTEYDDGFTYKLAEYYKRMSVDQIKNTLSIEKSHIIDYKGFFKYINSFDCMANDIKPVVLNKQLSLSRFICYSSSDSCYDPVKKELSVAALLNSINKGVRYFRFKVDKDNNVCSHKMTISLSSVGTTLKENAFKSLKSPCYIYLQGKKNIYEYSQNASKLINGILDSSSIISYPPIDKEYKMLTYEICQEKFIIQLNKEPIKEQNDIDDADGDNSGIKAVKKNQNKTGKELFSQGKGNFIDSKYSPEKAKELEDLHKTAFSSIKVGAQINMNGDELNVDAAVNANPIVGANLAEQANPMADANPLLQADPPIDASINPNPVAPTEEKKEPLHENENYEGQQAEEDESIYTNAEMFRNATIEVLKNKFDNEIGVVQIAKPANINPMYFWARGIQICQVKSGSMPALMQYVFSAIYGFDGYGMIPATKDELKLSIDIFGITQMRDIGEFESIFSLKLKYAIADSKEPILNWVDTVVECKNEVNIEIPLEPLILFCPKSGCLLFEIEYSNKVQYRAVIPFSTIRLGIRSTPLFDENNRRLAFSNLILKIADATLN